MAPHAPLSAADADAAKDAALRWVVEGELYDLTDFLATHPGGPDVLLWSQGRDITIPVMTFHKDPAKTVLPTLAKYKVARAAGDDDVKAKIGIPHFLLPSGFDAAKDVPTYDFRRGDDVLATARRAVLEPAFQTYLRRLDDLWDATCAALCAGYVALSLAFFRGALPWYVSVPGFVVLRTALAGGGHYYLHRKKPHAGDALFDANYVGMAFTAQDGHVLIHHAYTQSEADVKRGFFGACLFFSRGVAPRETRPRARRRHDGHPAPLPRARARRRRARRDRREDDKN